MFKLKVVKGNITSPLEDLMEPERRLGKCKWGTEDEFIGFG
jgi:hypothetical protein